MIKMIYTINPSEKAAELSWLRSQKIFPACENFFNWSTGKPVIKIGVIVGPEAALAIKLRHKLDTQDEYRQR